MTSELALRLGRAAAHVFRDSSRRHRIVIGKDTRLSGYMIESALTSGICSMGVDVLLVGPVPTPGIAFLTRSLRADAGVAISASHNSYEDNGIKTRLGTKISALDTRQSAIHFDDGEPVTYDNLLLAFADRLSFISNMAHQL